MKNWKLYLILLIAFIVDLFYLIKPHAIWWDASVYLGMGHYIYSLGSIGIWEPIRPLVWPILLGLFWKIGLNDVIVGYILGVLFSMGSVALSYLICKKLYNEEAGYIAALILAFTPLFSESVFRNMTELPSVFFALLAVHLFVSKKPLIAGIIAGVSFLTKFPNGIVIAVLLAASLTDFKKLWKLALGVSLAVMPYFIFNYLMYGSALSILVEADAVVKNAGTWLFSGPWHYYLFGIFMQNPLYLFSVIGIVFLVLERRYMIPALSVLLIAYFSYHMHKEMRFGLLMLPYFAILASIGIKRAFKQKWIFWAVMGIVAVVFICNLPSESALPAQRMGYLTYLEGKAVSGQVLAADPLVNLYSPKAIIPLYYPVFNSDLASKWIYYIKENKERISYVFADTCEGGIICNPSDNMCNEKKDELLSVLKKEFRAAYNAKRESCEYWVFEKP